MKPILGNLARDGSPQEVDIDRLIDTRLLVQANSGGGKSWAIRRLLEQTARGVQQLVIDPEGEFQTLREKFDYVICAPHDADAVANPQTAALLARRLIESGVSAILDIYDLKAHERQLFVKRFLESLVNLPKSIWRPVLVVLDEAHIFAPEGGGAEAMGPVIDIATRGRKRGQCLIAATQRLAKLHKDVAAELLNKLIGRTGLDIDVKRAASELGMSPKDATEKLRSLAPGGFYCFGPALSVSVEQLRIGEVLTTHPKSGQRMMKAPPAASAKILQTLAKLADLPTQAAEEIKTLEEARAEVTKLRREVTTLKKSGPAPQVDQGAIDKAVAEAMGIRDQEAGVYRQYVEMLLDRLKQVRSIAEPGELDLPKLMGAVGKVARVATTPAKPKPGPSKELMRTLDAIERFPSNGSIDGPTQKILNALAWWESIGVDTPAVPQVALVAGYSAGGGTFKEYIRRCNKGGLTAPNGGGLGLTDEGRGQAQAVEAAPSLEEYHRRLMDVVKEGPLVKILNAFIEEYETGIHARGNASHEFSLSTNEIGEATGYGSNGGTFKEYLRRVRKWGFIQSTSGAWAPTKLLFPEGLR